MRRYETISAERSFGLHIQTRELATQLDCAAMHPALAPSPKAYYRSAQRAKEELIAHLTSHFPQSHQFFLLGNTTHGITTLLLYLLSNDRFPISLYPGSYPPYESWLRNLLGRHLVPASKAHKVALFTHVSPVTGSVQALERTCPQALIVVDAAQSYGTALQNDLSANADIFVAPLHKHLGISQGLGVIAVAKDRIPTPLANGLCDHLEQATHGTMSLAVLQKACERMASHHRPDLNRARILVGELLAATASSLDVQILTESGVQAHILALRSSTATPLHKRWNLQMTGGRYQRKTGILRFSIHSSVIGCLSPAELEALLASHLRRCHQTEEV